MVGTLDGRVRAELGSLLVAVMRSDAARVANALLRLGAATAEAMEEALAAELDPQFHLGTALAPYARRHVLEQLSPAALAHRLEELGLEAADLPHRLLEDGLRVHLRGADLEPLIARVERLGNRIALSILAAAVFNALAELAATGRRPSRHS
jgi:ubiquinone biosynthesis protein